MDETFTAYPETKQFHKFCKDYLKSPAELRRLEFYGTIKIHGSNISIVFTSLNTWRIQSRNRILSAKDDLYDCFVTLNQLPLEKLAQEILCIHGNSTASDWKDIMVVGERAGKRIQKGVGVSQVDRFLTIFNIRIGHEWQDIRKFRYVSIY